MRLHRFIGLFDLSKKRLTIKDAAVCDQMRKVLRLQEGDEILLCDGRDTDARARIETMGKGTVEVVILSTEKNRRACTRRVTLYCAILKKENFELVCQKATEIGVSAIVPVRTARTVKQSLRMDRLAVIVREAAEQSGRGSVPVLSEPMDFTDALAQAKNTQAFFCDIDAPSYSGNVDAALSLFVGPEGGWDEAERAQAREATLIPLGLGQTILRAETAAIVAPFLFCNY